MSQNKESQEQIEEIDVKLEFFNQLCNEDNINNYTIIDVVDNIKTTGTYVKVANLESFERLIAVIKKKIILRYIPLIDKEKQLNQKIWYVIDDKTIYYLHLDINEKKDKK